MSEYPEELIARVTKALYISPVSDYWGETVPEIAAVCERAAVAALDALGLAEVWDAGYDVGYDDCRDGGRGETNPYREGPRDRD